MTLLPLGATLADGTTYAFTYEVTPGSCTPLSGTYATNCVTARIASATLPTGGTIYWAYSTGYHGIWTDGTTTGITRTNSIDGGAAWSYMRSGGGGDNRITDPQANQAYLLISGLYETRRQIYAVGGALLETLVTCYNGNSNLASCPGASVSTPISQKDIYTSIPDTGGKVNRHSESYNTTSGLLTRTQDYDFGQGANGSMLTQTAIIYATLGNPAFYVPSDIQAQDGSATPGNPVAHTTFSYDEGGAPAASGATQLGSPPNVARGNLTTIKQWTNISANTTLLKYFTYYDTGTVKQFTDANGGVTTSTYTSSACNYAFPSSVTYPITGLTTSVTWDCSGAKPTQVTGFNGEHTNYSWDSLWRPTTATDPLNNTLTTAYSSQTAAETYIYFNQGLGGVYYSLLDSIVTTDALGRKHVTSRRQGPSSPQIGYYESLETDYDSLGRPSRVTMPYLVTNGSAYTTNSSAPAQTITYDALSRPLTVTDAGSGKVTYAYSFNDVLTTVTETSGSPPAGEHDKKRQMEYDGAGRLKSVCEITTAADAGSCGQNNPQSGYWTQYTYDPMGNLTNVTQNAQPGVLGANQNRQFFYDALSRLTQEVNPETGTTNYFWDFGTSCGTYNGDLSKKQDASGNATCYAYDAMHRLTTTNTFTGPNAASTPLKYFTYDAATLNSQPMNNAKGRLAEAYTCTTYPCGTKLTDEGFSYSLRGELTDFYESTPHSGAYYHLSGSYFPHGLLSSISGVPQLPSISYGSFNSGGSYYNLDGEGRPLDAKDSNTTSLINPVVYNNSDPATTFEPLGAITQATFGNADADSFTYDWTTGRATQYKFTIGAANQYQQANLTWNPNGSLSQLNIVRDDFNAANVQTCNYTHDDLARLASVNCGSGKWGQNFAYDAYGNIKKTVPSGNIGTPFDQISYINQGDFKDYNQIYDGINFSYDGNGNLLSDSIHNYTWDADGHAKTIDTVTATYDALGRMVEQQNGSNYTQIVYGPDGGKLALMNGQSLVKAFVPLPGGATAVYGPSGVMYYRHSDWLGSSRLASTPSRCVYYDGAYAPFGESHAEYMNSTCNPQQVKDHSFTGQNEDTVSGLDDFLFREFSASQQGRWISPDPAGFLSANLANPQTWNLYAYVTNNPLRLVDSEGSEGEDSQCDSNGVCVAVTLVFDGNLPPEPLGYQDLALLFPQPIPELGDKVGTFVFNPATTDPSCWGICSRGDIHIVGGTNITMGLITINGLMLSPGGNGRSQDRDHGEGIVGSFARESNPFNLNSTFSLQALAIGQTISGIATWNLGQVASAADNTALGLTAGYANSSDPFAKYVGYYGTRASLVGSTTAAVAALALIAAEPAGLSTRAAFHGPHHTFGRLGARSHFQANFWLRGVKGVGWAFRIPFPW